jgi:signal transduction histidine kinase
MVSFFARLNVATECRTLKLKLKLWHCPPFLFFAMGFVTITAMVATYVVANRFVDEPQIAALIVSFIAALFFVVGNMIIHGFNEIVEANRTESEFVSIISHQLGTPLSIFRMTLDMMGKSGTSAGARDREDSESLKTLTDTTDNMIALVRSLVEVGRIGTGRMVLNREAFALDALTAQMKDSLATYAAANNVVLALEDGHPPPQVYADRERVKMAVQNLMDNAIRYSPSGGTVRIAVRPDGRTVRWSIRDAGVGIPEPEQKYIFQKFFRAGNAVHHNTHGSGIGLYIAKGVVEASGGKIGFRSAVGQGSEFWFTLPTAS